MRDDAEAEDAPVAAEPSSAGLAPIDANQGLRAATSPGRALNIGDPMLGLAGRLMQDRMVTTKGSRSGRRIGIVMALLGIGLLLLERRIWQVNETRYVVQVGGFAVTVFSVALAVAVIGIVVAVAFMFWPTRKRLQVKLAADQGAEWERVRQEAKLNAALPYAGYGLAALGVLVMAWAVMTQTAVAAYRPAAAGLVVAAVGLGVVAFASARRGHLQRLYIQTMMLAALEKTGLGSAADPRIGPVLRSLDQLLGNLPEAAVRSYLASPEAEIYLELLEETARDG